MIANDLPSSVPKQSCQLLIMRVIINYTPKGQRKDRKEIMMFQRGVNQCWLERGIAKKPLFSVFCSVRGLTSDHRPALTHRLTSNICFKCLPPQTLPLQKAMMLFSLSLFLNFSSNYVGLLKPVCCNSEDPLSVERKKRYSS